MANIFTWETQDIDLKDCIKLKIPCQQLDTMILKFNVYDYDSPVDLTNYNISFVAKKPDGTIYGQVENISKSNNSLTINCNNQLTSVNGRVVGILEITDNLGNRKGSYFIVLNVFGLVNSDDRVVSRNFVDVLERFDDDVNIAMSLSTSFKADIIEAQSIAEDFATKIPQASAMDIQLNETIDDANATNSTLVNTTISANTLENKLNSYITTGTILKDDLEENISMAGQTNDELTINIANADDKLIEFQNYDTTELVPLSNTMLNEMYCNKELLSINHGLNGYPIVKMTYTEYGAGVGGAGDFPASADSDCNLMQNKAIYTDNNNMTIYVPQNYYITNPSINKLNDYKYIVTFTNSTRSILIELVKGSISEDIKLINDSITSIEGSINDSITLINDSITLINDSLSERVKQTTSDITYYVNATTGNDSNDGLTSGTAFKTIAKSISMIPQIVNHAVTINVSSGTYTETIIVNGFMGIGKININGGTSNTNALSFVVDKILIQFCNCIIHVTGFTETTTSEDAISIIGTNFARIYSCICTSSSSSGGIRASYGSNCTVSNCIISNRSKAIMTSDSSTLFSDGNSGSGNTIGLYAVSLGVLFRYSTQPSGIYAQDTTVGGEIR